MAAKIINGGIATRKIFQWSVHRGCGERRIFENIESLRSERAELKFPSAALRKQKNTSAAQAWGEQATAVKSRAARPQRVYETAEKFWKTLSST